METYGVAEYAVGQYVELYSTIAVAEKSVTSGTRGVVRAIDEKRRAGDVYRVAFLSSERPTAEHAWVRAVDLLPG